MAENVYARYKFEVRRGVLICTGQNKTMRGTIFAKNRAEVKLEDRGAAALKSAMAQGIVELNNKE